MMLFIVQGLVLAPQARGSCAVTSVTLKSLCLSVVTNSPPYLSIWCAIALLYPTQPPLSSVQAARAEGGSSWGQGRGAAPSERTQTEGLTLLRQWKGNLPSFLIPPGESCPRTGLQCCLLGRGRCGWAHDAPPPLWYLVLFSGGALLQAGVQVPQ